MKAKRYTIGLAVGAAVFVAADFTWAGDREVGLYQAGLPQAVADSLSDQFGRVLVDDVETDVELGVFVYDLELYQHGREFDVEALPDGRILTIETRSRMALMPEPARAALPADLLDSPAKVKRIEVLHELSGDASPQVVYHVTKDGRFWVIDRSGRLLGQDASSQAVPRSQARSADDNTADAAAVNQAAAESTEPAAASSPQVQRIADVRRGQRVVLQGEVDRILDEDEFRLRDSSGTIEVYIGWRNALPVDVGQTVIVYGRADDDTLPFRRPDVYAHSLTLADGEVIHLRRGD